MSDILPSERPSLAMIAEMDAWLGLSPQAWEVLRHADDDRLCALADEWASVPALAIAGLDRLERAALCNWWNRIDQLISLGDLEHARRELIGFRGEIYGCLVHDSRLPDGPIMWVLVALTLPVLVLSAVYDVVRRAYRTVAPEDDRPPLAGEMLIYLALPAGVRQEALGDLAEEYAFAVAKFGKSYAIGWYWWQVAVAVLGRSIGRLARWSAELLVNFLARLMAALMKP